MLICLGNIPHLLIALMDVEKHSVYTLAYTVVLSKFMGTHELTEILLYYIISVELTKHLASHVFILSSTCSLHYTLPK